MIITFKAHMLALFVAIPILLPLVSARDWLSQVAMPELLATQSQALSKQQNRQDQSAKKGPVFQGHSCPEEPE